MEVAWYYRVFGFLLDSVITARIKLSDVTFTKIKFPEPNAHVKSVLFVDIFDKYIPSAIGAYRFIKSKEVGNITVDISDITAISCGKGIDPFVNDSSGKVYKDLDEYAWADYREEFNDVIKDTGMTKETVENFLSVNEVRITNNPPGDFIDKIKWNGKICLSNSGGAHRFSAARYVARQIGYKRPLTAKCYEYSIDGNEIKKFMSKNIFLIVKKNEFPLTSKKGSICYEVDNVCKDKNGRSLFFYQSFTEEPLQDYVALFFKRSKKTDKVATMLKECGALDLCEYLLHLEGGQSSMI
ncbi:DUF6685 family protein [Acidithiobacillus caldus]